MIPMERQKFILWFEIVLVVLLLLLTGCDRRLLIDSKWIPTATPTSTVTPSPTVCPTIEFPSSPLETPNVRRTLYLILFDPNEAARIQMTAEEVMSIQQAIEALMQKVVQGGDRVAVFQMGCRHFDYRCRLSNFVLPTPKPVGTLVPPSPTPIPTFTPVPSPTLPKNWTLFKATMIARAATQTATVVVPTATAIAIINSCAVSTWKQLYLEEAQKIEATRSAFATQIAHDVRAEIETESAFQSSQIPTPYAADVVFDGLAQISVIINNEKNNFDRFVVLIFDTMRDWRVNMETGQVHDLSFRDKIDLQDAEIIMVMPDCREVYDPPVCKTRLDVWTHLLMEEFGASNVISVPNKQVLEKLLAFLRSDS